MITRYNLDFDIAAAIILLLEMIYVRVQYLHDKYSSRLFIMLLHSSFLLAIVDILSSLMAVQAVLYLPKYKFELWHVVVAAIWTLHNDVIDYLFGQMPIYRIIDQYPSQIGYFTFWLSIACILLAFFESRKREYLQRL